MRRGIVLLGLSWLAFGCSDEVAGSSGIECTVNAQCLGQCIAGRCVLPPDMQMTDVFVIQPDQIDAQIVQVDAGVDMEAAPRFPNKLAIIGEAEPSVFYEQPLELKVQYVNDGATNADHDDVPIANETIELSFEPMEQMVLTAAHHTAMSNGDGTATFQLHSGVVGGRIRVVARAPGAQPAAWMVRVGKNPLSRVDVQVTYDGPHDRYLPTDFVDVTVQLVPGDCGADPATIPVNERLIAPNISPFVGNGTDYASFSEVPSGRQYSARAWGRSLTGLTLAQGCTEVVDGGGAQAAQVTVNLGDEPLNFASSFTVEHQFDIRDLVEDSNGSGLNDFLTALDILGAIGGGLGSGACPRGDGIFTLLCDFAAEEDPDLGLACQLARPIIFLASGTDPACYFEDLIENNLTPEQLNALDALGDLYRNFREFNVYGEMILGARYPDQEGFIRGNISRWDGVRFTWRENCQQGSQADCMRNFPFSLTTLSNMETSPFEGVFDALYNEATQSLFLAEHEMSLSYGVLVLVALQQWILPQAFPSGDINNNGAISFDELLISMLDCPNLSDATLQNLCSVGSLIGGVVLEELFLGIDDDLDFLKLEGSVRVADEVPLERCGDDAECSHGSTCTDGYCQPYNTLYDLKVDRLYDGNWNGTFDSNGALVPNVGFFSGCRAEDCVELEMLHDF